MTKTQIKNLALASFSNNGIDEKKVLKIIKLFKQSELRAYIKHLKAIDETKKIKVVLANKDMQKDSKKELSKIYKNKQIDFEYDENMILGLKIIDNDLIYEYNLKDAINKLCINIKQL